MVQRLLLLIAGVGALALTGCGTNKSTGLSGILLDPDLRPVDVEEDSPQYTLGSDAAFTVTVANSGGAGARDFTVKVLAYYVFSNPLACGAPQLVTSATLNVEGLDAGNAVALPIEIGLPTTYTANDAPGYTGCTQDRDYSGSWYLEVVVDSGDEVDEADEGNNVLIHNFVATGSSGGGGTPIDIGDKINN